MTKIYMAFSTPHSIEPLPQLTKEYLYDCIKKNTFRDLDIKRPTINEVIKLVSPSCYFVDDDYKYTPIFCGQVKVNEQSIYTFYSISYIAGYGIEAPLALVTPPPELTFNPPLQLKKHGTREWEVIGYREKTSKRNKITFLAEKPKAESDPEETRLGLKC